MTSQSKTDFAAAAPASADTIDQPADARTQRYWEVDTWRGIAICTMIAYHFAWDLWFFRLVPPDFNLYTGFWKYVQRFTASSFLLVMGVSLSLSYRYALQRKGSTDGLFPKFLLRGLKIIGLGLIVTVVTFAIGVGTVHFGILHLIGVSIILAYPFLRFRWLNFVLWLTFFVAGYFVYVDPLPVANNYLLWLGLRRPDYFTVDYFPLVPWFGVVLLGVFLGNTLYGNEGRNFYLPDWGDFLPFRFLQFLGRHSLFIYMIHQVVLYVLTFAFSIARFWWIGRQL